ncbi:MAG: DUF2141 domain-containing protein [Myxococcota bacterium]
MLGSLTLVAAAQAQSVDVQVHGVEGGGKVGCALYVSEDGFPDEDAKAAVAVEVAASTARDGIVVCRFEQVPAARIAVAVRHDVDGDGKLDTNLLGIPKEPYGFSNNAPLRTFGPPRFEDASVARTPRIRVDLRR